MTAQVLPFAQKSTVRDFTSLKTKIEYYQLVIRDWSMHLSQFEAVVLNQILDRTIGWGIQEARFTLPALYNGDNMYSGIAKAMSRRSMYRALASLEDRGFINRRPDRANRDKIYFSVNLGWSLEFSSKVPKRLRFGSRNQCHTGTVRCPTGTDPCPTGTLYTGTSSLVSKTGNHPDTARPELEKEEEGIRGKSPQSPPRRVMIDPSSLSVDTQIERIELMYRLALIATFPGTAYRTWTIREKGQIKVAIGTWQKGADLGEFFDWAVRNWTAIMNRQFRWMTKKPVPTTPSLGFLIAFLDQFADCRAENKLEDWMSDEDRTFLQSRSDEGHTDEEAIALLAKAMVQAALRPEMEKREIKLRARERAVVSKLARVDQMSKLVSAGPVRPRTRVPSAPQHSSVANAKSGLSASPVEPQSVVVPARRRRLVE